MGIRLGLPLDGIKAMAAEPAPFDLPGTPRRAFPTETRAATAGGTRSAPATVNDQAVADWLDAERHIIEQGEANAARRAERSGSPSLNRSTLAIIRDGDALAAGDRHRMLLSAAANLGEFGCPPALAQALLMEAGLDSGLPPKEVLRQIECGLTHGRGTRC